jgi:hypothetical protein
MGDKPVTGPLPIHRTAQTQNKRTETSMPWVGFEPTTLVFERAETACAATVGGRMKLLLHQNCVIGNIFMSGLFNGIRNRSAFLVINYTIISDYRIWNDVDGSSCGLLAKIWLNVGNRRKWKTASPVWLAHCTKRIASTHRLPRQPSRSIRDKNRITSVGFLYNP